MWRDVVQSTRRLSHRVQRLQALWFRQLQVCHHRCARVSQKAQPFQHFKLNCMCLTNESPQAKHAETDPRHGTPTMAHFQPPDCCQVDQGRSCFDRSDFRMHRCFGFGIASIFPQAGPSTMLQVRVRRFRFRSVWCCFSFHVSPCLEIEAHPQKTLRRTDCVYTILRVSN